MTTLARTLGLRDLILLIIGTVIGSGIFIVPSAVIRHVNGSVGPALLAWLVAGLLSLLGALTYGELSARDPKAGGLYVYIRNAFGPLPAFLYGWTLFFAIGSGSAATLATAFAMYVNHLLWLSPPVAKLISISMLAVVAVINVRGTRQSANVQNWATAIKVGAIVIMSMALLTLGQGFQNPSPEPGAGAGHGASVSGFGLAMISVLWAYEGWQYGSFSAGEALQAPRNFPHAFPIGSVALIALYLLANLGYLAALGSTGVARTESVAAAAVGTVMGPTAAKLVTIAILISIFSAANGLTLTSGPNQRDLCRLRSHQAETLAGCPSSNRTRIQVRIALVS